MAIAAACGVLAAALWGGATGEAQPLPNTYTLPASTTTPEGVATHSPAFWVSSYGDGTIYKGDIHDPRIHRWLAGETPQHPADGRTKAAGMKASKDGTKLFVAGGTTGYIWVYDTATKALIRRFDTHSTGAVNEPGEVGLLNEVTLAPTAAVAEAPACDRPVYVTDSKRPRIYRICASDLPTGTPGDTVKLTPWVSNLPNYAVDTGIPARANGIGANATSVVYVQSNTGQLWTVDRHTRQIAEVPVDSGPLPHGDGMLFDHNRLLVVRNASNEIDELKLNPATGHAIVAGTFTSASFAHPTGIAALTQRMLVVNSHKGSQASRFIVRAIPRPVP